MKQNEIWPHYFPIFPEILPVNLFLELETIRDNNDLMGEVESINNKMIFDSINLLLNNYRPYGIEGEPPIWSLRVRSARSILDYDMVIGDLMETLLRHSYTQLGKIPTDLELTENRQINEERIH